MGVELEWKYAATPAQQAAILAAYPGPWQQIAMQTTYFDTADAALSRQKCTLRVRLENGAPVCTLKTPLPDGSRGEWECSQGEILRGLEQLGRLGAPEGPLQAARAGLQELCTARFTRQALTLEAEGCVLELAVDAGFLAGKTRQQPLCEVEVELKAGKPQGAQAFAEALAARFGLVPEPRSKFQRALALTGEE